MVLSQSDAAKSLTAAAAKGNTDEVRRMLGPECRVHPDTVNQFGKTALQVMMMGNSNVTSLLLEHGADPNITDRRGVSPAHDAARTGFVDTLRALVEFGASVNRPDHTGTLPIHIAVREGYRDVIEFLAPLSNLKHPNASGETAVDLARASSSCTPDVVELLERQLESKVFSHSPPLPL
ncbi:cyclin-dependent kinase 4 inhibitor D [Salvelinus alpinus]|uniref:cyclin-dependent kinase 4 inhibitor D n=1 Tax=Salvelinus alpinus TaxID=8036 RepID=UPI0039FBD786